MPIYEYRCQHCGHQWEEFLLGGEKPPRSCPRCGGAIRRLLPSSVGIAFKGSGFYVTDYKKPPSTQGNPSDGCGKCVDKSCE